MMTAIEQLQQIGLNKYEDEAYYTLLAEGPLTGYELGKRSQVPLSKSYEVLERLTQKGLALVQPGDPPRYKAEDSNRFLGQMRQSMTKTLDDLATSLATIVHSPTSDEFWVLRGYQHILSRAQAMVIVAQQTIYLYLSAAYDTELADVLVDELEALAGTLTSAGHSQAVVSSNQAIVTALSGFFAQQSIVENAISTSPWETTPQIEQNDRLDWVAWEDRKQRRLWRLGTDNRVARSLIKVYT